MGAPGQHPLAPQTSVMGYYFPYSPALRAYDHSSFNPALSDFAVSLHEVEALMRDLSAVEAPAASSVLGKRLPFLLLVPVIFYGGFFLAFGRLAHNNIAGFFTLMFLTYALIVLLVGWVVCGCFGNNLEAFQKRRNAVVQVLQRHQATTFNCRGVVLGCSQLAGYVAVEFEFRRGFCAPVHAFAASARPPGPPASTNYPEPPLFGQNPEGDGLNPLRASGYAMVPQS